MATMTETPPPRAAPPPPARQTHRRAQPTARVQSEGVNAGAMQSEGIHTGAMRSEGIHTGAMQSEGIYTGDMQLARLAPTNVLGKSTMHSVACMTGARWC